MSIKIELLGYVQDVKLHAPGEVVEYDEAEAKRLIAAGVAQAVKAQDKPKQQAVHKGEAK